MSIPLAYCVEAHTRIFADASYLAVNHLGAWYDYTFGPFVFIACFACMQRSLMGMIGLRYKDMFAIMKKRLGR